MSNTFLISDTHFGHTNITKFMREDGTKLRPWDDVNVMDEVMIENWNKVVSKNDRVWHLGDVVINRRCLQILDRLNGRLGLIMGNHDIFKISDYTPYFDRIYGTHKLDKFILSHVPIHKSHMARWSAGNIHGHLHTNRVLTETGEIDPNYICVCVEQINYTPIPFDEIRNQYK